MRYWMQVQAPGGNWVDSLGANDIESCLAHGDYLTQEHGKVTRVIERMDVVIAAPIQPPQRTKS